MDASLEHIRFCQAGYRESDPARAEQTLMTKQGAGDALRKQPATLGKATERKHLVIMGFYKVIKSGKERKRVAKMWTEHSWDSCRGRTVLLGLRFTC